MNFPPWGEENKARVQARKEPAPGNLEGSKGVEESQKVSQERSLTDALFSLSEM